MDSEDTFCQQLAERFNNLPWHDSKLVGFSIVPSSNSLNDEVVIEVEMIDFNEGAKWKRMKIAFAECSVARLDLDLLGKRYCSDAISIGYCQQWSDLKTQIESGTIHYEVGNQESFKDNLHFTIKLIEPGGQIDIIAKAFEILVRTTTS